MSAGAQMRLAAGIGAVALVVAVALIGAAGSGPEAFVRWMQARHAVLPVLGHIPAFELVSGTGGSFTSDTMLGHVSVVDFIFTHCTSSCPRLTARMAELQDRLRRHGRDVRLVSFSVDAENDTPEVLAEYAAHAHADPHQWTFVTGPVDAVEKAVVQGFKISAARVAKGAGDYDVVHGNWFVLIDRAGDLRGYYPVGEPQEFQTLVDDVLRLEDDRR